MKIIVGKKKKKKCKKKIIIIIKKKIAIVKNNIAIRIAGKVSRYIDASMNRATPSFCMGSAWSGPLAVADGDIGM